ncbi:hypothetical protein LOC68_07545 [Blastopirellula sp. JC732]|uniref:Uncharacterized protein n=1 Tax=Blastopirellula sediminis TaxID=2894196 RepID=A0A9X1SIN8_9BACT|nr:hypothetical protein [Blastopirellula sediminis]MCC9608979.1 hypothetical protein [Blastopirellula sediminis]MCC9628244.1 hypothetical protein [Blastopirellula sediminis]
MSESLYGQTDNEGRYRLYSRMDQALPIGKYAVTIVKRVNEGGDWADHGNGWGDRCNDRIDRDHEIAVRGDDWAEHGDETRRDRRRWHGHHDFRSMHVIDLLPEHYGDGPTSGLIAVIEPGSNVFDFALTDEAPKVSQEVVAHDRTARFSLN